MSKFRIRLTERALGHLSESMSVGEGTDSQLLSSSNARPNGLLISCPRRRSWAFLISG